MQRYYRRKISLTLDVDECAEKDKCTKSHEICINDIGSYRCNCEDGYRRNTNTNECELNIEGKDKKLMVFPVFILLTKQKAQLFVRIKFSVRFSSRRAPVLRARESSSVRVIRRN